MGRFSGKRENVREILTNEGKGEKIGARGFLGLDTETQDGRAVLIGLSNGSYSVFPKSFRRAVEFLRSVRSDFWAWNADYDIQAILKFLPRRCLKDLAIFTRCEWKDYKVRFIPRKYLSVSVKGRRLFSVFDLCQFYNKKLEAASKDLLGEAKREIPKSWYKSMGDCLSDGRASQVIDYCLQDAKLVEKIGNLTRDKFAAVNIDFSRPVSCASLAVQRFRPLMEHRIWRSVNEGFRQSYRGGRIECLKLGYFPKAYLYDINSAYPSVMAQMHGVYGRVSGNGLPANKAGLPANKAGMPANKAGRLYEDTVGELDVKEAEEYVDRKDLAYASIKATFRIPDDVYCPPVPVFVEQENVVIYPVGVFSAWVDLDTFKEAKKRGWVDKVHKGWVVLMNGNSRPFGELAELYEARKKHPEQSWALKVIMNALYGKFAQIIKRWVLVRNFRLDEVEFYNGKPYRQVEQWTHVTNFVYAHYITSQIRLKLWRLGFFDKVIFYATDGIASTEPLPIETSDAFGAWSYQGEVRDLVVVGSGVYTYEDEDGRTTHYRGFSCDLDLVKLLASHRYRIGNSVLRNTSLKKMVREESWADFNRLIEHDRFLNIRFDKKRHWIGGERRLGCDLLKRQYESKPWGYYGEVRIKP